MAKREMVIRDTHRGVKFRDGVLVEVLGAGRHRLVPQWPKVENYPDRIRRAHVKDLVFPGNLQDIMNRVLAAERLSEAERVDARTKAETARIAAEAKAAVAVEEARSRAEAVRLAAQAEADRLRIREAAEQEALRLRADMAATYTEHPELLRLRELEALEQLGANANARLFIGVDNVLDGDRS